MLSRRDLRIKVLQALYSFFQSKNDRLDIGERQLLTSIDKINDLFIYQLSFLIEVIDFAKKRIEDGKKKFIPSEEDLNPDTRFANNRIIYQLSENRNLFNKIVQRKISWADEEEMIRRIYQKFRDSEDYQKFIDNENDSYQTDMDILALFIKKYINEDDSLKFHYEEMNIHWAEDYYTVTFLLLKFLKTIGKNWSEFKALPEIYKDIDEEGRSDDRKFVIDLFRKSVINSRKYEELITNKTKNWEFDRIAIMDVILIKMAICEFIEFPSIPTKVSLNEYIEISKAYSSPKSKIFINGILDKLVEDLSNLDQIKKIGE